MDEGITLPLNPSAPRDLVDARVCLKCFAGIEDLQEWTPTRLGRQLRHVVPAIRGHALGSLMEYARPDDVLRWVSALQLIDDWPLAFHELRRRRWLYEQVVRCLKLLNLDLPEAAPSLRRARRSQPREVAEKELKELTLALLDLARDRGTIHLAFIVVSVEEGVDLEQALRLALLVEPTLSVFDLAEVMIESNPRALASLCSFDEAAIARQLAGVRKLTEVLLNGVLRSISRPPS